MATTGSIEPPAIDSKQEQQLPPQECLTCRIIGTGALAGVGIYALQLARPAQPGPPAVKRVYTGIGILMLGLGVLRAAGWPKNKCVLATAWSL